CVPRIRNPYLQPFGCRLSRLGHLVKPSCRHDSRVGVLPGVGLSDRDTPRNEDDADRVPPIPTATQPPLHRASAAVGPIAARCSRSDARATSPPAAAKEPS